MNGFAKNTMTLNADMDGLKCIIGKEVMLQTKLEETCKRLQSTLKNLRPLQHTTKYRLNVTALTPLIEQAWRRREISFHPLIKPNTLSNEVRIAIGPADSDPKSALADHYAKQGSKSKLNNEITLVQWNIRGLSTKEKADIINSFNSDIVALQETGHPDKKLLEYIHKTSIVLKQRDKDVKGGGSITLSDLNTSSKSEFHINKDSSLTRLVLDGVFVIWFGNIYLNRGLSRRIQKLFSVIQMTIPEHERPNLILAGDFNINLNDHNNSKIILLDTLCKPVSYTHLTLPTICSV